MKITETKIKVSDLVENYSDDGDNGVYGYNNRLTVRPSFQRLYIYITTNSVQPLLIP